ncbi:MAG: DUF1320 family protein [Candidatus Kapabacteria bacterium]|nr:DUF1320 family protein [Candidatus Kapabacteria bacterium]
MAETPSNGYSSYEDLCVELTTTELARLTGDPTGQIVNADKILYAIKQAKNIIDSFLYGRYTLPLPDATDPEIQKISIDLSLVQLHEMAYRTALIPQTVIQRKIAAISKLKDIQDGKLVLSFAKAATNAPPVIVTNKTVANRIFDDRTLDNFFGKG